MNRSIRWMAAVIITLMIGTQVSAQQGNRGRGGAGGGPPFGRGPGEGRGFGRGPGFGRGGGGPGQARGHGHDERHQADQEVFHFLLDNHKKITRTVKELPNGVQTLTESESPEVADKIKEHVEWMTVRIEESNPIRMRDPLFAEIFRHTDKIKMVHEDTANGVRVTETSDDPYVVRLIQEHAKVVTGFVNRGFDEAMKNHAVPGDKGSTAADQAAFPRIQGHGGVIKMPTAAQQPRPGTKLLIDLTRGDDPEKLNHAVEKVAKYVNIYAGAGAEPADASIAVIFHGDATLAVLNPDAYSARFGTQGNPNLDLLRQLHEAGVELYVCGQSLNSKGATTDELVVFVDPAVSALTTVANLQSEGYAHIPLGN
ncbi:DsrE family protein [Roseiconus nitratireducens]|uniref:DsrE family protein n=1 Tax=Roseiconus nitratireducens TaxID=2605748 RepID=A0A5M6D2U8_9BACT|nr:DsrE family protein [Roseiconus nitratireducens]KAA5541837.1 DsrE family protein [Roseiconus nitratireducens]